MEFDQEGRNSCDQYWCAAAPDALRAISALTMALIHPCLGDAAKCSEAVPACQHAAHMQLHEKIIGTAGMACAKASHARTCPWGQGAACDALVRAPAGRSWRR